MPFKPNYGQQRAERDRAKRAKRAEKLKELQEQSERRKVEREISPTTESSADNGSADNQDAAD